MRVAQRFAGYSLAEADNLRKAAGKKDREVMAKEREKFIDGCETTGYGAELGKQALRHHRAVRRLRVQQEPHVRLRPHRLADRVAQGQPSGRVPRRAAHDRSATTRTRLRSTSPSAAASASRCSSPTSTLSINVFASAGRAIRFGLSSVRNVGEGLVERIVAEREANGPFEDFFDFCQRVDPVVLNKRTIESLIKAGAFDSLGHPRKGLCVSFEQIVDRTLDRRREREIGVMSLFDAVDEDRRAGLGRRQGRRFPTSSSTRRHDWPSRRRCSACT